MSIFEYNEEEEKRKIGEIYYKQGQEKGWEEGLEKGLKKGLTEGIRAVIKGYHKFGIPREKAFDEIMTQFGLTEEKTEEFFLSYWQ